MTSSDMPVVTQHLPRLIDLRGLQVAWCRKIAGTFNTRCWNTRFSAHDDINNTNIFYVDLGVIAPHLSSCHGWWVMTGAEA
jgi:hypothetical protein